MRELSTPDPSPSEGLLSNRDVLSNVPGRAGRGWLSFQSSMTEISCPSPSRSGHVHFNDVDGDRLVGETRLRNIEILSQACLANESHGRGGGQ